jgi:hypothetical protein
MRSLKRNLSMVVGLVALNVEWAAGRLHSGDCPRVRVRYLKGLSRLLKKNGI